MAVRPLQAALPNVARNEAVAGLVVVLHTVGGANSVPECNMQAAAVGEKTNSAERAVQILLALRSGSLQSGRGRECHETFKEVSVTSRKTGKGLLMKKRRSKTTDLKLCFSA